VEGTDGVWLDAADSLALEQVVDGVKLMIPKDGTSLVNAFKRIADFDDPPDNLFLLTDGLPTQGEQPPKRYMVTGDTRRKHFNSAITALPSGLTVNTILFPMEGDPEAAALYWQLAIDSKGSFIAPSRDWP
jgi:hypothetical protein